ncbi:MAG: D-alanyl-D-alanine carboxypeptidase [Lentisphaeria bacterium]|nr:D-alanyl-D-alanine carboxypeptidase [Lentisphaeria bacterium]
MEQKNEFNFKKITRKQIIIWAGMVVAIILIHCLLLSGSCSTPETKVDTPPPENVTPPPPPPPPPVELPPQPVKPATVEPWNYDRQQNLPQALEKRFKQGKGRSGILIDLNSRRVLWSKYPNRAVPVASLTKLMTALLVMEQLDKDPNFKWSTVLTAYPSAIKVPGRESVKIPVGGLMQAMLIASNNGAAVVLAEALANGDPVRFAARMNTRARELGMDSTNFNSPNGLPQGKKRVNSRASAADICHICELLMGYSKVIKICSSPVAHVQYIGRVSATNRLINPKKGDVPVDGVFGFKTGYTKAAGFCLAFGVERGDRTVIGCVTGFQSSRERDIFCRELIEWAYRR